MKVNGVISTSISSSEKKHLIALVANENDISLAARIPKRNWYKTENSRWFYENPEIRIANSGSSKHTPEKRKKLK